MVLRRSQEIELHNRKHKVFGVIKNQILKQYKESMLNEVIAKKRRIKMVKQMISLRTLSKVIITMERNIYHNKVKL